MARTNTKAQIQTDASLALDFLLEALANDPALWRNTSLRLAAQFAATAADGKKIGPHVEDYEMRYAASISARHANQGD